MPFWYFATVPELPPEVSHQDGTVRFLQYIVAEGDRVEPGAPLAVVENYWARLEIQANGEGFVSKTFFDPGAIVRIGDPFVIVKCDGEKVPYGRPYTTIRVVTVYREKPLKRKDRTSRE